METESKEEQRIKGLRDSLALTETGYAGIDKNGQKVDWRVFPDAIPLQYNPSLNNPFPNEVKKIRHTWLNFPNANNQKCTRCGILRNNINREILYTKEKTVYKLAPNCIEL